MSLAAQKSAAWTDEFQHVSETAVWVALGRAQESMRSDALFRDPFARVLAGETGEAILRNMKGSRSSSWIFVVRTHAIDELILNAIGKHKIDAVVNLGAGLDTRPFRLALPATLAWHEIDFPELLAYKKSKLGTAIPRCHLEYHGVDVRDREKLDALFRQVGSQAKRILLLTEGVVCYLKESVVENLTASVTGCPQIKVWIQDFYTDLVVRHIRGRWRKELRRTPFEFNPPVHPLEFFSARGWRSDDIKYGLVEAARLRRQMPFGRILGWLQLLLPKAIRNLINHGFGYATLVRNDLAEKGKA